ncbi:MAG: hypothetical protein KBA53_07885 [Thermoclostridium sp.]|nr:hypothetical protein [Thermoclostridium sp.]
MLNTMNRVKDIHPFTIEKARLKPYQSIRLAAMVFLYRHRLRSRRDKPFGSNIMINSRRFMNTVTGIFTLICLLLCLLLASPGIVPSAALKAFAVSGNEGSDIASNLLSGSQPGTDGSTAHTESSKVLDPEENNFTYTKKMRLYTNEGRFNQSLKLYNEIKQSTTLNSEQLYLAGVAYFQLRDYKNSFECMMAAVQACTDPAGLDQYANTFSEIFMQDYKMLSDANVISSCLDKKMLLYQSLEQAIALKRQNLQ